MMREEAACLAWVTGYIPSRVPRPPSTTQHPASSTQSPGIVSDPSRAACHAMPCHAYHNIHIHMLYIRTYTYICTYILGWSRQYGQKRYAGNMRTRSRYWEGAVVNLIYWTRRGLASAFTPSSSCTVSTANASANANALTRGKGHKCS